MVVWVGPARRKGMGRIGANQGNGRLRGKAKGEGDERQTDGDDGDRGKVACTTRTRTRRSPTSCNEEESASLARWCEKKRKRKCHLCQSEENARVQLAWKRRPLAFRSDGKGVPAANHASLGKEWLLCTSQRLGLSGHLAYTTG